MAEEHIYKALTPFTMGLIPSRMKTVIDGAGNISMGAPSRSVRIVFNNGTFIVNEETARSHLDTNGVPFTIKGLVKALEGHKLFGTKYKKVFDSTKEPTKEQAEFNEKADKSNAKRGVGVTQGARAKKS